MEEEVPSNYKNNQRQTPSNFDHGDVPEAARGNPTAEKREPQPK